MSIIARTTGTNARTDAEIELIAKTVINSFVAADLNLVADLSSQLNGVLTTFNVGEDWYNGRAYLNGILINDFIISSDPLGTNTFTMSFAPRSGRGFLFIYDRVFSGIPGPAPALAQGPFTVPENIVVDPLLAASGILVLADTPIPNSLFVIHNGVLLIEGVGFNFTLASSTLTFITTLSVGETLSIRYQTLPP